MYILNMMVIFLHKSYLFFEYYRQTKEITKKQGHPVF